MTVQVQLINVYGGHKASHVLPVAGCSQRALSWGKTQELPGVLLTVAHGLLIQDDLSHPGTRKAHGSMGEASFFYETRKGTAVVIVRDESSAAQSRLLVFWLGWMPMYPNTVQKYD